MRNSLAVIIRFLLEHAGELGIAAASIVALVASAKVPLSAETEWRLCVSALAAVAFGSWYKQVRRADTAEAALEAERSKPKTERIFVEEPQALLDRIHHTGMLAEKLLIPQLDTWISVSGRFEGVAESLLGDAIHLSLILDTGRRIPIEFAVRSRNRLELLREGQRITAICQIRHGHGAGVFELRNSELIRVERPRQVLARAS
jgi:hypothetical protein